MHEIDHTSLFLSFLFQSNLGEWGGGGVMYCTTLFRTFRISEDLVEMIVALTLNIAK